MINNSSQITLHGVLIELWDVGVLITGQSGIGKSELALGLIERSHRLVADDSVLFSKTSDSKLMGQCPPALQDFLAIRGFGIINIRALFGDHAISERAPLHLIISLFKNTPNETTNMHDLSGIQTIESILNVDIPKICIPFFPGRNIITLVETAVRNQQLKNHGHDAHIEFISRQREFINNDRKKHDS